MPAITSAASRRFGTALRHERRRLDLGDAGCRKQVDQLDLAFGGNESGFDLQAVARDDIVDVDALGHVSTSWSSPWGTHSITPFARNRSTSSAP
jgi:hypothetical protein